MSRIIHCIRRDSLSPVRRGKGIVNFPVVTKKLGARSIHSGLTYLPPGAAVPLHSHHAEEFVIILKGQIKFWLDGTEYECGLHDSTFIGANVKHEFINSGTEEALALVTYGAADITRTFADTGKEVVLGSDDDRFDTSD